jgi:ribosome-associated translation inhibitor RaiA
MIIQIYHGEVKKSDSIDDHINERINKELAHIEDRITRVEVHLHDDNGADKPGRDDKRVTIEARPAGRQPLAVEHKGENMKQVISDASGKLARALKHAFDKAK